MPKAFSEEERKQAASRLVEAGQRLFATYGLKKTNVEELAAAAGISKGAFYLFYESKESLFMDVMEQAEQNFRQEVLDAIGAPGPTPRARLLAGLKVAYSLWKTIPVLSFLARGEYETLRHRVPIEKVIEHVNSDREFAAQMIAHCQAQGIPIQISAESLGWLLYSALFVSMHEGDFGEGGFAGTLDILLELIAAYCLGEVPMG